ncbi:hypothetical protein [Halopiger goleimassiliensis]|uniref:hypothetical protein n=1 Tax=Halopiger goleimassiliensis TaxID=1293048 RepID=UPI00067785BC|nr:hypothetical protein [Halopiger goleimassiliensis]
MPIETYRLEIRDVDGLGIDVDVYNADDVIEESTHVAYDDYDLEPTEEGPTDSSYTEEITTDVTTLDLQYERDDGGFSFRLLGDRDELTTVRLEDDEWGVS